MATFTATPAMLGYPVRVSDTGLIVQSWEYQGIGNTAPGDVILCCKIPNGATIIDAAVRIGHKADTQATVQLYVNSVGQSTISTIVNMGAFAGSATAQGLLRPVTAGTGWRVKKVELSEAGGGAPYALFKVSYSTGTTTTSFSMNGWVSYAMDQ